MKLQTIIISLFWGLSAAFSQENTHLSVDEALTLAKEHNYQLQQADYRVQAAQKETFSYITTGLPQVNLSSSMSKSFKIPHIPFPDPANPGENIFVAIGVPYSGDVTLSATQLIFSGTYIVGLKASKLLIEQNTQELQKTWQETQVAVMQAYFLVLIAQANQAIFTDIVATNEALYQDMQAYYEAGLREDIDADQMKLLVLQSQTSLNEATAAEENAMRMLNFLLGQDINTPLVLTDSLPVFVDDVNVATRPIVVEKNIDYQMATLNLQAMKYNYQSKMTAFLPELSAFFNYGQQSFGDNFGDATKEFFPNVVGGIQLNWKIFASLGRRADVQKAQLDRLDAELGQTMVSQNIITEGMKSYTDLKTAHQTYLDKVENESLAKRISDKTEKKYTNGIVSSTDFANNQNQYLRANAERIGALIEMLNADLSYKKVLGEFLEEEKE